MSLTSLPFLFCILMPKILFWYIKSGGQGVRKGTSEEKVQPNIKAKGQKRVWLQLHSAPTQCTKQTKKVLSLVDAC